MDSLISRAMTNAEWVNQILDECDAATDGLRKMMLVATAVEVRAGKHDQSPFRPTIGTELANRGTE